MYVVFYSIQSNQLDMDVATDTAEATDHHELTEDNYTSEALGESDDDIVRGRNRGDGDMDEDDDNDRYYVNIPDKLCQSFVNKYLICLY